MHSSAACYFRPPSVAIFDIFAASGESIAWVLLWKTRSRPIGVSVCLVVPFDFQHRIWPACVDDGCFLDRLFGTPAPTSFTWERRRRWGQLSITANIYFLWWSWCSFRSRPRRPYPQPQDHLIRQITLNFHQCCLQFLHLLVEREHERWINRVSDRVRGRHCQILNLFTFQWVMAMMTSHHWQQDNVIGHDRVSDHVLTHKCLRNRKCNLWSSQNLVQIQMSIPQLWIPHPQPESHLQLSNEIAPEDNKDPDRVSVHFNEHIHLHNLASSPNMMYLLLENLRLSLWPVRIQMENQKLWNHSAALVTDPLYCKVKNIHKIKRKERRKWRSQMIHLVPQSTSLWIQTRTMKNRKMNQEPVLPLKRQLWWRKQWA